MSSDQVAAALGGAVASVSQGLGSGSGWGCYGDWGVTAVYGEDSGLLAVAIDAMDGPLVRLRDVELIARVPSEVRSDIHDLARREGASVRVNRSGDPEVEAWGVSLGASLELGLSSEGYVQRGDAVITNALIVGPEAAADPHGADPIVQWQGAPEQEPDAGTWPVKAERDRPRWDWTPLEGVGPLRFGMYPSQVAASLDEEPAARHGRYPFGEPWEGPGEWILYGDRFDTAGVTAHYSYGRSRLPELGAVTVHGRTGPQVEFEGIRLIGMPVSAVDTALTRRLEENGTGMVIGCGGDLGPDGLHMYVRAARAGDAAISEARFCGAEWEDHG
ncbi:hypothetical protein [Streptomyces sudanensis]|uniref:hypothetical protein n=1 Tax=Streptomyces sudanensis TaxID=436397 RepID=UPI0020CF70AF|nr:hypothetical protein [Streptomyces sudanensis]MCP9956807.1 hypothetical protein [Streptomyces sudanensis]